MVNLLFVQTVVSSLCYLSAFNLNFGGGIFKKLYS